MSLCLSQGWVAKEAGITQPRLSQIEGGQSCSIKTLARIVGSLGAEVTIELKPATAELRLRVKAEMPETTHFVNRQTGRVEEHVRKDRKSMAVKAEIERSLQSIRNNGDGE